MDGIINIMSSRGINVLFSIVTSPTWARPNKGGTGGPPEDFNLYAILLARWLVTIVGVYRRLKSE